MVLAIVGQHSLHDAANRIVLHLNQKMKVVGHQTVGVEVEGQLRFLLSKNAGEPDVVVVRAEYLSAIIPTSNDVIEPSPDFDTWLSRHNGAGAIAGKDNMSRNSSLTPPDAVFSRSGRWGSVMLFSLDLAGGEANSLTASSVAAKGII